MKRTSTPRAFPFNAQRPAHVALPGMLTLAALLAACSTPVGRRSADTEQCYRHADMRTCTTRPAATPEQIAAVHRMSPPPPDRGRLLIVRNDWADAHGHAIVRLDGQVLIDTIPCSVFAVDVRPGVHRLQIDPAAFPGPLLLEVAPGQLLVWQATRAGMDKKRSFALSSLDPGEARDLVQECRVLGLLDRTAPAAPSRD